MAWDKSSSESLEFTAWLSRSLPVTVSVVAEAPRSWTKSLSPKKYSKWLATETEKITSRALSSLKSHIPRTLWAQEPCSLVDVDAERSAVVAAAREAGADLIVFNSNAKLSQARFLASSIADELMHSSPLPLGLTPKGVKLSKKGITRVNFVFLRAGTDRDTSGLASAARLAAHLGVPLRLISLLPEMPSEDELDATIGPAAGMTHSHEASLSLLDVARDEAYAAATEFRPACSDLFELETAVASGNGWEKAVSAVKWKKGDLICLGSHPTAQRRRVLVGSRASEFLRYAPAPVIVFPRHEAE